jgi:hypothetical protein
MGLRSSLYKVARLMGDANAVKKGKGEKRATMNLHLPLFSRFGKGAIISF